MLNIKYIHISKYFSTLVPENSLINHVVRACVEG